MHLRVNYLRLLLRATYLVEKLLVPTPLEAFYLYRAEHTQYPASQTHTASCPPRAGSTVSQPVLCVLVYLLELVLLVYTLLYIYVTHLLR